MNNSDKKYNIIRKLTKIIAVAAPIAAAVIALSYFFALRYDFDFSIGHFERQSLLFYITMAGIGIGLIVPTVLALYSNKSISVTKSHETSGAVPFFAIFAAVMALFACFTQIPGILSSHPLSKLALGGTLGLIAVALSMLCLVFPKLGTTRIAQILFTLATLAINLEILSNYFDQTMPLNSPVRHIVMLCEIFVMMFFLSEARLSFGLQKTASGETSRRAPFPFFIFANAACASVTLGVSAGALLFSLLCSTDIPTVDHPSALRLTMYIAIGALAAARLSSASKITSTYVCSTAEDESTVEETSTAEDSENPISAEQAENIALTENASTEPDGANDKNEN